MSIFPWLLAIPFGLSIAGLAYVLMKALYSGTEAYSGAYSERTAREFEDIFLFIPPRRIAEIGWASAGVVFLLVFMLTGSLTSVSGFLVGLVLASAMAGVALLSPRWLFVFLKTRRLRRFNLQLVDTLVNMSNALKAGFSIMQAFEAVVKEGQNPISQEFDVCLQQTRVGVSFSDALNNLEQRVGSDDLTLVVMAIETARKTGGNLTEIFEKIASTIRERMRIENRIRTLTAQGRLQGFVAGSMPVVIIVLLVLFRPEMMIPFLHSRMGMIVIGVVAMLVLFGALSIRKIIRIDI